MSVLEFLFDSGLAVEYAENASADKGREEQASNLPATGNHFFSDHAPLWNWINPVLRKPFAKERGDAVLFDFLESGSTFRECAEQTNFFVFIGASSSEAFEFAMSRPGVFVMLFEPDCGRFHAFAETLNPGEQARAEVLYFSGDFMELMPYLSEKLTRVVNQRLFPVFFIQEGYEQVYSGFIKTVIEQIEILYYRACIYPIEGHWGSGCLPLRDITRDLFYDQLKHLYENLTAYLSCGNLDTLKGILPGRTAVLIAPGPDLDTRIEYLKECRQRGAVLIAVTRALPTLLEHGLEPHFALINDNSIEAGEQVMDVLPEMKETVLIAQCLSPIGKGAFKNVFFFGNILEELFPKRVDLRLHGSVITTCYSLAAFLGCAECVLVGAQLAGHNPKSWELSYSKKGKLSDKAARKDWKEGQWPYLYPVTSQSGKEMYTSINFLDAAIWFREEICRVGLPVVNTTEESIIFGRGIRMQRDYLPAPAESPYAVIEAAIEAIESSGGSGKPAAVEEFIATQNRMWTNTRRACRTMVKTLEAGADMKEALDLLATFDRNNTSYLLERYRLAETLVIKDFTGQGEIETAAGTRFRTQDFYDMMFKPDSDLSRRTMEWYGDPDAPRRCCLHYYFALCEHMAAYLTDVLADQRKKVRELRLEMPA